MLVNCWFTLLLALVYSVTKCNSITAGNSNLIFFYGSNYLQYQTYSVDALDEILNHERFDSSKTTVLYSHGYLDSPNGETVRLIVNAYKARGEHNLIVVDWADAVRGDYNLLAVPNSVTLGNILGTAVVNAFKKGLDREKFHVVGHSLGAQLSGMIGRRVISESGQKLRRITGLDPAGPGFFDNTLAHLSRSDAEFVDIIHTDASFYGQAISTGTVDFWPNNGRLQPGCTFSIYGTNVLCSHIRAVKYYAESVASPKGTTFLATSRTGSAVNMGIDCPTNANGDYYLYTNGLPPYSRR